MPTTSPIQSLPVPEAADPTDVPADLMALAQSLEDKLVMRFSTAGARDTVLTAPAAGMICFLEATGEFQVREPSRWFTFAQVGQVAARQTRRAFGTFLSGTNNNNKPLMVQSGTFVARTNTSGSFTMNFPQPFTQSLSSLVVCIGDTPSPTFTHVDGVSFPGTAKNSSLTVTAKYNNLSKFQVWLGGEGTGGDKSHRLGGSSNVRYNWIATGL